MDTSFTNPTLVEYLLSGKKHTLIAETKASTQQHGHLSFVLKIQRLIVVDRPLLSTRAICSSPTLIKQHE